MIVYLKWGKSATVDNNIYIIMKSFTVDEILNTGDPCKIYLYFLCVAQFRRVDLLNIIYLHLNENKSVNNEILCNIIILSQIPKKRVIMILDKKFYRVYRHWKHLT